MPNWKKVILSGSDASVGTLIVSGAAAIGTSSLGPFENTLTLGARDNGSEGGQLGFNAPGGTYASASFIDLYQNRLRILKGTNATSTGEVARWDMHNNQMGLPAYTSPSSFTGTVAGLLAFDSSGNIITTAAGGSGTVTSVATAGTVSGITLTGGTITTSGTITLGGSISGLTNSNLSGTAGITNANLANSSVTIGSTAISLGGTSTTLAGLTSVTSTAFTGSLFGVASQALQAQFVKINDDSSTDAARPVVFTDVVGSSQALSTDTAAFTYNPSTNTLSVTNLAGTASVADTIETARNLTNAAFYPTFVDSHNATATPETVYTAGGITFNPSTNAVSAASFTGSSFTGSLLGNVAGTASWATNVVGGIGVTSVGGTGTVNGITLTGTVTSTGNLTLGGTLSGIANSNLSGTAGITNANLANSSVTIGSTAISLGATSTTLAGLTNVNSTNFTGSLQGTASLATSATSASTQTITTNALHYPVFVDADNATPTAEKLGTDANYNFNPSTNRLDITGSLGVTAGITGSLQGTATTASKVITGLVTTNATHFIPFVDTNHLATGVNFLGTVNNLQYNPTAGSLTNTSFTGSLRGTASYATYASQSGYTIQMVLATTGSNPVSNTTYYMGAPVRNLLNTVSGATRIYIPRPGRARHVWVYVRTNGTLASAGTTTVSLQKNASTAETLGTSTTIGSVGSVSFESTAVSMSLVQGDFIDIRLAFPNWGTAPTAVEASAVVYIENNL